MEQSDTTDIDALRRLAIYSSLLALVISVPSSLAFFAAFGWNIEAGLFGDPAAILSGGLTAAALLRWGAITDMFYSYLLLVPLALYLHRRLRPLKPWLADIGLIGALAYMLIGAAAASILATVGSSLIEAYDGVSEAQRPAIASSFVFVRDLVFFAIWQTLDPLTAGTWVASTGWLYLPDRPLIGRFLVLLGVGLMAMSAMTIFGIHSLAGIGAIIAVVMVLWSAWVVASRRVPLDT
jgi:hypothetical protein